MIKDSPLRLAPMGPALLSSADVAFFPRRCRKAPGRAFGGEQKQDLDRGMETSSGYGRQTEN